ncbi:hypothetical protein B5M09_005551 [Aphanomyces astaci]|uniref:Uncharacterized protein n=1 Tax=Aphanomyces astaci TaxID=112090 RepID=A0A3R7WQ38_APHAT|nr:hypothetical protein B5M09_005551 [Aphanomyces astaci]
MGFDDSCSATTTTTRVLDIQSDWQTTEDDSFWVSSSDRVVLTYPDPIAGAHVLAHGSTPTSMHTVHKADASTAGIPSSTYHIADQSRYSLTVATDSYSMSFFTPHTQTPLQAQVVSTSPNGAFLGVGGADGLFHVLQVPTHTSLQLAGHVSDVTHVEFFPSSLVALTGSADFSLRIWSVQTFTCGAVLRGHKGAISGIGILGRGRNVHAPKTASSSCGIAGRATATATGTCRRRRGASGAGVRAIEMVDKAAWVATADGSCSRWSGLAMGQTPTVTGELVGPTYDAVNGVSVSSNGTISSVSRDGLEEVALTKELHRKQIALGKLRLQVAHLRHIRLASLRDCLVCEADLCVDATDSVVTPDDHTFLLPEPQKTQVDWCPPTLPLSVNEDASTSVHFAAMASANTQAVLEVEIAVVGDIF